MIEHVPEKILFVFQFAYIIWPLFVITALAYSLQFSRKRGWLRTLSKKIHANLLYTWLALFGIWLVTLFAETPPPTLIPEPANSILFFSGLALLVFLELLRLRSFPRRIRARIELHEVQGVAYFRSLAPDEFEELVAETYRALGYSASRVGKSGDHGVDVDIRTPKGERWIVQVKRYRDSVGESTVRELYGTLMSEGAERGVLVTSADITLPAETWAKGKPIDLVDGPTLLRLVERARRRAEGSLFDRFTNALAGLFQPARRPAGLPAITAQQPVDAAGQASAAGQTSLSFPTTSDQGSFAQTQPVRVQTARSGSNTVGGQGNRLSIPQRLCPACGAPLEPHPQRSGRNLYRCTRYPACRVVVNG